MNKTPALQGGEEVRFFIYLSGVCMLAEKRVAYGTYINLIMEIVYEHGCITKKKLVDIIAEKLNKPRNIVENSVARRLTSLVRKGVIERVTPGIYCRPGFRKITIPV